MKSIYDKYGSRGITVAEQLGEDVSNSTDIIGYGMCYVIHTLTKNTSGL